MAVVAEETGEDSWFSASDRRVPETPIGKCVAIVTAASVQDHDLVMKLLHESQHLRLLEAMAAVAVVFFNSLRSAVGDHRARALLSELGVVCSAVDEDLADIT